ncbi:MAG TPA: tRNA (adenosine(37)-N6)-threonylcarbamoyltransferase complex ATPase subunit type 1 TsaE [Candidatus Paceibacterota bacterium]|jgi:ATPase, YjeE family
MISKSVEETGKIARGMAASLKAQSASATVLALSGDLGSGKTTFTKAFAAAYGVPEDDITSPTFVIMKGYDVDKNGFKKLIHIDAYRLEKPEEAEQIGWKALIADPNNLILVEWPEKLGDFLPKAAKNISFRFVDDVTRRVDFQ